MRVGFLTRTEQLGDYLTRVGGDLMFTCIYRYDIACDCFPNCKGCTINYNDTNEIEDSEDSEWAEEK